jgi:hypothetical protein
MARLAGSCLFGLLVFAVMGLGYAGWSNLLFIRSTASTGVLVVGVRGLEINDWGKHSWAPGGPFWLPDHVDDEFSAANKPTLMEEQDTAPIVGDNSSEGKMGVGSGPDLLEIDGTADPGVEDEPRNAYSGAQFPGTNTGEGGEPEPDVQQADTDSGGEDPPAALAGSEANLSAEKSSSTSGSEVSCSLVHDRYCLASRDGNHNPRYGKKTDPNTGSISWIDGSSLFSIGNKTFYEDVRVMIGRGCPGYTPTFTLEVGNGGTVPAKIEQVNFEWVSAKVNGVKLGKWRVSFPGGHQEDGEGLASLRRVMQGALLDPEEVLEISLQFPCTKGFDLANGIFTVAYYSWNLR